MTDGTSEDKDRILKLREKSRDVVLGLREMLADKLTEKDRRNVLHFVEVGEYSLAFEQVVLALLEEQKEIADDDYRALCEGYIYFSRSLDEVDKKTIEKLKDQIG